MPFSLISSIMQHGLVIQGLRSQLNKDPFGVLLIKPMFSLNLWCTTFVLPAVGDLLVWFYVVLNEFAS